MADDMFGDSELFEEFDKERDTSGSFLLFEKDEQGYEDRSKYVFQVSESSSSEDSDDDEEKLKVKESVAFAKQNETHKTVDFKGNEQVPEHNGIENDIDSGSEQDDTPVVSKERQDKLTSYKLNFERNKFKRYCNIIDSTRFIHDEESASVQILFQNNRFSRKYKTQIEDFVKQLIDQEANVEFETLQKLDLKSSVPSCSELNEKIPIEKRTDRMYKAHAIIGCSQFYSHFVVDTLGWPLVEYNPSLTESWDIPAYEQVLTDVLPIDEAERRAVARKMERERMKPKCWNCDGDHMLNECKLPKNQSKINENRQIMMANKQQKSNDGPKSARYHKERGSEDPKYSKFKPGVISDELREALGIDDEQLPQYIYRMRALGYPPGWMEEAKAAPGLSMFDKDGNDMDENIEEGETGREPLLNVQKIIEYPGFTVEAPADIVDEAEMYGLPPLQPHQLKATLISHTQIQEAMKRELEEQEGKAAKRQKVDTDEMDLDDNAEIKEAMIDYNPPLPPETPPARPPMPLTTPPPTPDETSRQSSVNYSRESSQPRSDSPSLEELEEKYKLLQKSLMSDNEDGDLVVLDSCDDESSQSSIAGEKSSNPIELDSFDDGGNSKNPIEIANDSMDSTEEFDFVKPKLIRTGSTTSIQTFGELGTGSPASSNPGTPVHTPTIDFKPTFKGSTSVSKDYGTPILKRAGSIDALPTDSKFAQGIEDHIPFENLPESTGRFNTLRKIVDKIRKIKPINRKKK